MMFARTSRVLAASAQVATRSRLLAVSHVRAPTFVERPVASTFIRSFSSDQDARKKLSEQIRREIKEELERDKENNSKNEPRNETPFKVVSESDSGDVALAHQVNGYKVTIKFNATDLTYDYRPVEEDDELSQTVGSLPCKIEIQPTGSDLTLLVSGTVEEFMSDDDAEEGQNEEFNSELPFFTPETVQFGKSGAIEETAYSPDLSELDEELQDSIATWLDSLEIDQETCGFVLAKAEEKENSIYLKWLQNLQKVVDKK